MANPFALVPVRQHSHGVVMILDLDDGQSRILSIDESGCEESILDDIDALARQVLARRPELILLSPHAANPTGSELLRRLNGTQDGDGYELSISSHDWPAFN